MIQVLARATPCPPPDDCESEDDFGAGAMPRARAFSQARVSGSPGDVVARSTGLLPGTKWPSMGGSIDHRPCDDLARSSTPSPGQLRPSAPSATQSRCSTGPLRRHVLVGTRCRWTARPHSGADDVGTSLAQRCQPGVRASQRRPAPRLRRNDPPPRHRLHRCSRALAGNPRALPPIVAAVRSAAWSWAVARPWSPQCTQS